jgi:lipoprotein-anchoring transpeptidase ErfK/SrfK
MAQDRSSHARLLARSILVAALVGTGCLALASRTPAPPRPAPIPTRAAPAPVRAAPRVERPAPKPSPTAYTIKRILPIDGPLRYGAWHWDEAGAPATGAIVVTVDLTARVLSVFRDGYEIGTTAVIYGADEKPTPLGIFPVTQKDADHRSNIYGGAPMPYMLRMTNDGVSIHGSNVSPELMTHGCVGVPVAFAKKLFGVVKLGDKVIVTNGERLDLGQPVTAA